MRRCYLQEPSHLHSISHTARPRILGREAMLVRKAYYLLLELADLVFCLLVMDNFQSNGACHDTCLAQYAFAVVQGFNCWCSDYVPFDTTSTALCDQDCPGFPSDKCGNTTAGLYGYIALSVQPSGTQGATSSSTSSTAAASSTVQVVSCSSNEQLVNTICVFVKKSHLPYHFPVKTVFQCKKWKEFNLFFTDRASEPESCNCSGNCYGSAIGPNHYCFNSGAACGADHHCVNRGFTFGTDFSHFYSTFPFDNILYY